MDLTVVENLIKLMKGHEVSDLSYQDADVKIRVRFGGAAATPVVSATPVRAAEPAAASPAAPPRVHAHEIKSPIVGTFYRAPKPDAPPFVNVGDRVRKGEVLCIIEAMKLLNEIESDVDGVVSEIMVENASAVQFGQPLFRIVTG